MSAAVLNDEGVEQFLGFLEKVNRLREQREHSPRKSSLVFSSSTSFSSSTGSLSLLSAASSPRRLSFSGGFPSSSSSSSSPIRGNPSSSSPIKSPLRSRSTSLVGYAGKKVGGRHYDGVAHSRTKPVGLSPYRRQRLQGIQQGQNGPKAPHRYHWMTDEDDDVKGKTQETSPPQPKKPHRYHWMTDEDEDVKSKAQEASPPQPKKPHRYHWMTDEDFEQDAALLPSSSPPLSAASEQRPSTTSSSPQRVPDLAAPKTARSLFKSPAAPVKHPEGKRVRFAEENITVAVDSDDEHGGDQMVGASPSGSSSSSQDEDEEEEEEDDHGNEQDDDEEIDVGVPSHELFRRRRNDSLAYPLSALDIAMARKRQQEALLAVASVASSSLDNSSAAFVAAVVTASNAASVSGQLTLPPQQIAHRTPSAGGKPVFIYCEKSGCSATFTSKRLYREHIQCHDQWVHGRFYCDFPGCDKSFCRGYSLKYHRYTHTEDAPFACEFPGCDKRFSHSSRLKRHFLSHTPNEKSFECLFPECGKRFSQKCHLKIHMQSHERKVPSQDEVEASPESSK